MAIIAYTGLPGSGKSYGVVENVVLPALRAERRIVTNLALKLEVIIQDFPTAQVEYVGTELKDPSWWARSELAGAIVILDEVWQVWPSGLKVNHAIEEHKAFLAEHRHLVGSDGLTTEVCLICQDLSQIAAWVRALVETTYRSVKLTAVGSERKFRIDIYNGAQTGQSPPESARIRQIFGQYNESVYKYYISHTKAALGSVGKEKRADNRASILKSWLVVVGMPLGLVAVIVGVFMTVSFFKSPSSEANAMTKGTTHNKTIQSNKPMVLVSKDWRITGQINDYLIITGKDGLFRRIRLSSRVCISNSMGEWQCKIDGQLITEYSGPANTDYSIQVNSFPGLGEGSINPQ